MAFSKLLRWLAGYDLAEAPLRPRESRSQLVTVEQFERRLCLGTVATTAIADWSADEPLPPPAADVLVLEEPQFTKEPVGTGVETPTGVQDPTNNVRLGVIRQVSVETGPIQYIPDGVVDNIAGAYNFSAPPEPQYWGYQSGRYGQVAMLHGADRQLVNNSQSTEGPALSLPAFTEHVLTNPPNLRATLGSNLSQTNPSSGGPTLSPQVTSLVDAQLKASEVKTLLDRASAATASQDAIIAVVDRFGRILGVRMEDGVLAAIPDDATRVFAIDGAVAKARTAALFANGQLDVGTVGPLTSRTVRFISQSTVTQREVESNPNVDGTSGATADASTTRGPGFVAPIGVGGHFPPEVLNTPLVDLFGIEHTNRDSNLHPGADTVRGTADDFELRTKPGELGRFNIDPTYVPAGQELYAPESYGATQNSGLLVDAQSRGIATLPGGIPLFRDTDFDGIGDTVIGGIGVFFPGSDGYATHEQGFDPTKNQSEFELTNSAKSLEAEFIALAAAGGSKGANAMAPGAKVGDIAGVGAVPFIDLPFGRIDLVGITLQIIGPSAGCDGVQAVLDVGEAVGPGVVNGVDMPLTMNDDGMNHRDGKVVPEGYLVTPHDSPSGTMTEAQVRAIIEQGIAAAKETRAAIRLPEGNRTKMVFAVTDTNGEILGLYRMEDATTFSIDVAVAKARNVAYYADPTDLQSVDQLPGIAAGTAFTNRTFRFASAPRYPTGNTDPEPAFESTLLEGNINNATARNEGAPDPVSAFDRWLGYDAFHPMTNFHDPGDPGVVAAGGAPQPLANTSGVVFFPGSTPLYANGVLIGGLGVSGDGVDQDDVVTFLGANGFRPAAPVTRADQVSFDGVRLPYQKFLRNPFG